MDMMLPPKDVDFKTFDGTTLRGDLYLPAGANGTSLVILTHGVRRTNCYR
jgi:predicted acyl esterase